MSFLRAGKDRPGGIDIPLLHSVRRAPGCVQCGAGLEMDGKGFFALSGRCMNCTARDWDEVEDFEDPEF
jgi:hypothetical protein